MTKRHRIRRAPVPEDETTLRADVEGRIAILELSTQRHGYPYRLIRIDKLLRDQGKSWEDIK